MRWRRQINAFHSLSNPLVTGYTATVIGSVLTITGAANCIPRLGANATLGKVIHKQRQSVMVTVWAPDHISRSTIAAAIDILIKKRLVVTMPDTSMAEICYNRTNVTDELEPVACYRRDLIILADYATVELFLVQSSHRSRPKSRRSTPKLRISSVLQRSHRRRANGL